MTQMKKARSGVITPEMKSIAVNEQVDEAWLRDQVAMGKVAIPANKRHSGLAPCGIGEGLLIKVMPTSGLLPTGPFLRRNWQNSGPH